MNHATPTKNAVIMIHKIIHHTVLSDGKTPHDFMASSSNAALPLLSPFMSLPSPHRRRSISVPATTLFTPRPQHSLRFLEVIISVIGSIAEARESDRGVRSTLPSRSEILMQRWYGPIRTSGRS